MVIYFIVKNRRYRVGQKATVVCDEGYEIRGRLGGVGAKLECKEDGSWESPVSSKHSKQVPFCKGKHLRYDYMKTDFVC